MNKIKSLYLKLSLAVAGALAYAGSTLAVYVPDAIDTAVDAGVTSVYDRIMNFFTSNLGTIFLIVGGILLLWFAIKTMRKSLGR